MRESKVKKNKTNLDSNPRVGIDKEQIDRRGGRKGHGKGEERV